MDASFGGIDAETSAAGKSRDPQGIPRHQTRRVVKKRRPLLYVPNHSNTTLVTLYTLLGAQTDSGFVKTTISTSFDRAPENLE